MARKVAKIAPELYWSGGPFRVRLSYPLAASREAVEQGIKVLEEFRAGCQKGYCAFSGSVTGQRDAIAKYKQLLTSPEKRFSVGRGPPGGEQLPGRSTIATLRQGEFLDAMDEGGEFENLRNQALLVMIYHRWDEVYRYRISRAFGVRKNDVYCVLMGDVRLVRNVIVHENAVVTGELACRFLERIWAPSRLVSYG